MKTFLAHKENAPGDFYVEDGCCLTCAVPFTVAPDMFAWSSDGNEQCIVCRQPSTPEDLDRMLAAFRVADMGCIRYKGSERPILMRLVAAKEHAQCDDLPPDLLVEAIRRPVFGVSFASDARAICAAVGRVFRSLENWLRRNA